MKKTSFKQRLLLVIFGVFLAVIFLEIGLRIAGSIVLYLQERHDHLTFDHHEYRILCLGESTTALGGEDSYPSQLEGMLNAQHHQIKFTVINKGTIGTTTDHILAHLDQDLDMNKPQLVIVMMGINDRFYLHDQQKFSWLDNVGACLKDLRVYKLAHLLYEHITHRIKEAKAGPQKKDLSFIKEGNPQQVENFLKLLLANSMERFQEHMSRHESQLAKESAITATSICIELAHRYRLQGSFPEAQGILEQAAIFNVNYQYVYQEWGELYLAQGKSAQAIKAFQAVLALEPQNSNAFLGLARSLYQEHNDQAFLVYARYLQLKPQDYWGYIEVAQWLREEKQNDLAQEYLVRAIQVAPYIDQAYVDMGQVLDDQKQFPKEEAFYLKEISLHPKIPRLYQVLAEFYQKQGRQDLAKSYFQKAVQPDVSEYYPATLANYSRLVDKILDRHINVMVMQYPLRDIGFLKNYLGQRKGITFVENRQNFRQALSIEGYSHYFKDSFGNDFGHCTRAGNELIARNLAGFILKNTLMR